jgi:sulfide:quinone oxidoreductase
VSVCTSGHATQTASAALEEVIDTCGRDARRHSSSGWATAACTCEGAAFEYVFNVDHTAARAGRARSCAELIYLTNEHELGDFGVGGMTFDMQRQREVTRASSG